LAGKIALAGKQYDEAITELQQSNLQDPYNLYRLAVGLSGQGRHGEGTRLRRQGGSLEWTAGPELRAGSQQGGADGWNHLAGATWDQAPDAGRLVPSATRYSYY
jgi:hypothetical protein